ncbi:MAG: ribonuclease P protein component [Parcubacteria group bacterium CG08_land_8_20_14_0_20_38_56]|nr:MAG: ribonuclease P protein component [Parcubacteria group bacterium CG08_land_8_20_14_0_20_38_56]
MLPRENRLKKEEDFKKVFKKGRGFTNNLFVLKIVKNNLDISRFAFVISKKISKKATIRNRIKRRLDNVIRVDLPKIKKGWDGIIIVLPGAEIKDFKEIEEDINQLLEKARLI